LHFNLEFASDSKKVLSLKGETQTYPEAVAYVFQKSLEKVDEKNPAAGELIRLCCFLDSDSIPDIIFKKGRKYLGEELSKAGEDDIEWNEVIREATRFSLIQRNRDKESLRIHRLVQQVIRENLENSKEWAKRAAMALSYGFPDPNEFKNWPLCEKALPNAHSMLNWIDKYNLKVPGRTFACAGLFQVNYGIYPDAELFYKKALDLNRSFYGENHPNVATALINLGDLYRNQCRYEEAGPLFLKALEMDKKLHGAEHIDVATSLNNLAGLYLEQGRYEEAEPLYQAALEMSKKLLGEEHSDVAVSLNNLGSFEAKQRNYSQAVEYFERAYSLFIKLLGTKHPYSIKCKESLDKVRSQVG
jgi:tetratricopeptide (TPR) repeat protein